MSRLSAAFFAAAVLYVLTGMVMGMVMGATHDHSLKSVHVHINLLGWASLGLMGAFYGIAGDKAPRRLGWTNFGLSNIGNLMMLPMLAIVVRGGEPILPLFVGGQVLIVVGMLVFGAAVVITGFRKPAPVRQPEPAFVAETRKAA